MGTTRDLLVKHGMYSHWLDPKLCTLQEKGDWKELVYEAVEGAEDGALRARFAAMTGASAARYARVKNWDKTESEFAVLSGETGRRGAQVIEPYLDDRAEHVGTRLKLMCRLGCLPTMERVAREEKLPPREGQCRLCSMGAVETTDHLLLACPTHDRHRKKMLAGVEAALASAWRPELMGMPETEQADTLLGKSTGAACSDDTINKHVTRFLKKAWRGRKWLTSTLNDSLGRDDTTWALRAHGDGRCKATGPTPRRSR